jgi:hypothetical protein
MERSDVLDEGCVRPDRFVEGRSTVTSIHRERLFECRMGHFLSPRPDYFEPSLSLSITAFPALIRVFTATVCLLFEFVIVFLLGLI